ncbi:MAG: protein-L-isoaspartate(D-aspartate) O-methyltransferase [Candidatus Eisenbacteria bacterium]|jgi:protein-L-isoaspartate(D-aspartate) O-methyltransferase|nr:protein-L-isoaspartate(D-aspartate) O-methyltransferase [Candidatus Eisenbacteria bacterium]
MAADVPTRKTPRGSVLGRDRILQAMERVPRERFISPSLGPLAYAGYALPIGGEQTISSVETVVLLCEALLLRGGERILEIGTGSGYQAAVMAELGCKVYSVERVAELSRAARKLLDKLGYLQVLVRWGDGGDGWPAHAPYDRIVVTAACPRVPEPLPEQLGRGGVMVVPAGERRNQRLIRITRGISGRLMSTVLEPCNFVPLLGRWGWSEKSACQTSGPGMRGGGDPGGDLWA